MLDGSPVGIARGFGSYLELAPGKLSIDPDDPQDKVRNNFFFRYFNKLIIW